MFSIKKTDINALENRYSIIKNITSGSIDTTFGPNKDGKVFTDINNNSRDEAYSLRLDDEYIYLGGRTDDGGGNNFALVRYNKDGTIDTNFGPNKDGKVVTDINNSNDSGRSLQLDTSHIYLGGYTYANGSDDFALVRYNKNGTIDTDFGQDGKVVTDINNTFDIGYSLRLDDNHIYLGGFTYANGSRDFALVRYNKDDSIDKIDKMINIKFKG